MNANATNTVALHDDVRKLENLFAQNAFARLDESDDGQFHGRDRFVNHLDTVALKTVEQLIGQLVVKDQAVILDQMAGWNSHLPAALTPAKVVGVGLIRNELENNRALIEWVMDDLNKDPRLPFVDDQFDAVINTVSMDYMTQPIEVFREVGRVLKEGGLFLVVFSSRMFPQKVTQLWRQSSEPESIVLVEEFFRLAGMYEEVSTFLSKGRPRPADDKYAHMGIPCDPVYAVYGRKGDSSAKQRPTIEPVADARHIACPPELEHRMAVINETLQCPYYGERMRKWQIPQTPFTTWDLEFIYICFNDICPYFVRGLQAMNRQRNRGLSYRLR
jgi:SAM-dependent methyltransferase